MTLISVEIKLIFINTLPIDIISDTHIPTQRNLFLNEIYSAAKLVNVLPPSLFNVRSENRGGCSQI